MNSHAMDLDDVPFKVGQDVELKSFTVGYRGAWFRCKIKDICKKNGAIHFSMKYHDFPGEKTRWTKLYQKAPKSDRKMHLVLRPTFPPVYRESQSLDTSADSELVVIMNDSLKVGDLVDWWCDGCYWSGNITKVLGDEKFQVDLLPDPIGEGESYEVSCKDLRPSLDWSPEHGWFIPTPTDCEDYRPCAQLVKPVNQGKGYMIPVNQVHAAVESGKGHQGTAKGLDDKISANSPLTPPMLEKEAGTPLKSVAPKKMLTPKPEMIVDVPCGGETRTDGNFFLNSSCPGTIDDAVLQLEELANRLNWMKSMLEFQMIPISNSKRLPWKYVDHRAPSLPR